MMDELDRTQRSISGLPIVTVFGAGIAGLTAAHELVERGLVVRVVEREPDPDQEYACQAGGLAANQLGRTPADVDRVHPYLFPRSPQTPERVDEEGDEACVWIWLPPLAGPDEVLRIHVDSAHFDVDTAAASAPTPELKAVAVAAAIVAKTPPGQGFVVLQPDAARAELKLRLDPPSGVPKVRVTRVAGGGAEQPTRLVLRESGALAGELRRPAKMRPVQERFPLPQQLRFPRSFVAGNWLDETDERGISNLLKVDGIWETLKRAYETYAEDLERWTHATGKPLGGRMKRREELLVEIRGYTDSDGLPESNRERSLKWTELVRDELVLRNASEGEPIPHLKLRLVRIGCGGSAPIGDPLSALDRRRSNRVELRIVENVIPGEHGYRFFPRFYRHLFDSMKRTPLFGPDGAVTHETAFDQLVPTDHVDVSVEGYGKPGRPDPESIPTRRPRSLEELRELIELHLAPEKLGLSERDLWRFQLRILRFLTSSNRRRESEYAEQSWWQFLRGDVAPGYSANMQRLLRDTPQALVAMNADETDAFSQGLIYCQLLMDGLLDEAATNYTLNGPTSAAWIQHWKRYLKRQGVRFYRGELKELQWQGEELRPVVTVPAARCEELLLSLGTATPRSVTIEVQAMPKIDVAAATGLEVIQQLKAELEKPDYGVIVVTDAEGEREGRFTLRAGEMTNRGPRAFRPGERLVRFQRVPGVAGVIVINGSEAAIPNPLETVALGGELSGVSLKRTGERGLIVSPRLDVAIVSVLSDDAGDYGISLGGRRFELRSDGRLDRTTIRDRLLGLLAAHRAARFGTTGILLPASARPDVSEWYGRMGFGPDIVPDRAAGQLVLDAGQVSVSVGGTLGVVNAFAEEVVAFDPTCTLDFDDSDFYVLAFPLEPASRLVAQAQQSRLDGAAIGGCLSQLLAFELATGRRDAAWNERPLVRDASGRPQPGWPLRDLSGIQFYFENHVRVGKGHSYFHGAPWGLSSISQLSYWRERMAQHSPFLGQLSVDVGTWYAPGLGKASAQTAWRSSRQAIAEEVWAQILAGIEELEATKVVPPRWYHLDRGIRFEPGCLRGEPVAWKPDPALPAYALTLDGTLVQPVPNAPPHQGKPELVRLAIALHAQGYAADVVDSGNLLVVAPRVQGVGSVTLRVLEQKAGIRYRVMVGSRLAEVEVLVDPSAPSAVRDLLVQQINATAIGAVATPGAAENELRIQLGAPGTAVSALAAAGSAGALRHALALAPAGVFGVDAATNLYEAGPGDCSASRNDTMFLINNPKLWRHRPGLVETPDGSRSRILYPLSRKRWVLAGNVPATHTRLATMESANESARHAVIAILHAIVTSDVAADCPGQGTLLGSFPDVWDPAEHELDDAEPLKRLDERLYDEGLPHFFEILELDKWVEGLPADLVPADLAAKLGTLVTHAIETSKQDWKFTELDELIETARSGLKRVLDV